MSLQLQLVKVAIVKFVEIQHRSSGYALVAFLPVEQEWDMRSVRSIAERFSGYDAADIVDSPSEAISISLPYVANTKPEEK